MAPGRRVRIGVVDRRPDQVKIQNIGEIGLIDNRAIDESRQHLRQRSNSRSESPDPTSGDELDATALAIAHTRTLYSATLGNQCIDRQLSRVHVGTQLETVGEQ